MVKSSKVLSRLLTSSVGVCVYCGKQIFIKSSAAKNLATVDHIVPRSKGGKNDQQNLTPSCQPCNSTKSNLDHNEFLYLLDCDDIKFNKFLQKNLRQREKAEIKQIRKYKRDLLFIFILIYKHFPNFKTNINLQKKTKWEVNIGRIRNQRKKNKKLIDNF